MNTRSLSIVALGLVLLIAASPAAPIDRGDDPSTPVSDRWRVLVGGPSSSITLEQPSGIAVDSFGRVWVADARRDRLFALDAHGALIGEWSGPGEGMGQFERPTGVALDRAGNVYVADSDKHRIEVLDATGEPLEIVGRRGSELGELERPWSIAIGADGALYVADTGNRRVVVRSPVSQDAR